MIELDMVRRMARRGLVVGPIVIAVVAAWGGIEWGVSAAVGVAMTLGNLYLSALIIGGVADRSPQMLLPAGLAAFAIGLAVLVGVALALRALDLVYFPVTGFVLIGTHMVLVLWEAAGAYGKVDGRASKSALNVRS